MTTPRRKKPGRITKAQQKEFNRGWLQRNKDLKSAGIPGDTFEQYMEWLHGKGKEKSTTAYRQELYTPPRTQVRTALETCISSTLKDTKNPEEKKSQFARLTGPCSSKPPMVYTGTKMVGIAVMHKSNAVPVFSNDEAVEISSMRR